MPVTDSGGVPSPSRRQAPLPQQLLTLAVERDAPVRPIRSPLGAGKMTTQAQTEENVEYLCIPFEHLSTCGLKNAGRKARPSRRVWLSHPGC